LGLVSGKSPDADLTGRGAGIDPFYKHYVSFTKLPLLSTFDKFLCFVTVLLKALPQWHDERADLVWFLLIRFPRFQKFAMNC
jgi:hypothetical protein